MKLSKSVIRKLARLFEYLTHPEISEICDIIDVDLELSYGSNKKERLTNLMHELNGDDKLNQLIQEIFNEYGGNSYIDEINEILRPDGYSITEEGYMTTSIGEIVQLKKKLSDIETGLQNIGFDNVLKYFKDGVDAYGRGKNFQDIRNALEGLVEKIIISEGGNYKKYMRENMKTLFKYSILKHCNKPFKVNGYKMELEHAHAYGIFSLLSEYIDHFNEITDETDKHFVFSQSVILIWLLVKRYLEYSED